MDQQVIGNTLLVIARDQSGAPFKTFTFPIEPGARKSVERMRAVPLDEIFLGNGAKLVTKTETYSGKSAIYVVTTFNTYDARGNIVDIEVQTKTIPKSLIQ